MKRFVLSCKMEVLRLLRNPFYIIFALLMPVGFYILYTTVFPVGTGTPSEWAGYYLMSMTSFSVMGSAITTFCARNIQETTQGFTTLIQITPLPSSIYFICKMIGQTLIHLVSIITIFVVGILVNGVTLPFLTWLLCGLWILVGAFSFLALGSLLSNIKKLDAAVGISNMLYFALAILGGMWMPMEMMPRMIQQIGAWLPSYAFRNGVWTLSAGHLPEARDMLILLGYLIVFMLLSTYFRNKRGSALV